MKQTTTDQLILALADAETMQLAKQCANALHGLAQAKTPAVFINDALIFGEVEGQSVGECLSATLDELRSAASEATTDMVTIGQRVKARNAESARESALRKYRGAGLRDDQIKKMGVEPSPDTVNGWLRQAKELEGEIVRLEAFLADPLHRIDRLQGLELIIPFRGRVQAEA